MGSTHDKTVLDSSKNQGQSSGSKKDEPSSLEEALARLEEIVKKMEAGNLNLNEGLELFEKGVNLTKFCNEKIQEAERRVEMLVKKADGSFEKVPFAEEGE